MDRRSLVVYGRLRADGIEVNHMAFRVCCSCKTPLGPSEGFVSRLCRVTQTLGTVIGDEDYFWSPVSGYTDKWDMSFTAPSTGNFLLEGFRVEWYGPTADGQKFNGLFPVSDTTDITQLWKLIPNNYLNEVNSIGTLNTSDSELVFRNINGSPLYSNLLNTKVSLGGHVSNDTLLGLSFGMQLDHKFLRFSDAVYNTLPSSMRLKYWRMLENGSPVTDVINGYHPDSRTTQTMYPISDITTTNWNTSSGTDVWSLIDEDSSVTNNADYVWSGSSSNDELELQLSNFTYTGGYNEVRVFISATMVDASGALIATGSRSHKFELVYNGDVIAAGIEVISGNGVAFTQQQMVFKSLSDFAVASTNSLLRLYGTSSYIPVDAEVDKFSIRITPAATSTQRLAISMINVQSVAFSYFAGTNSSSVPNAYWPIEKAYQIPWRKNVRLGFDLWFEVVANSGASWSADLGKRNATSGKYEGLTSTAAHGSLGIRTTFMPEYSTADFTYYVKLLNGTWRPANMDVEDTDRITFSTSNIVAAAFERSGFSKSMGSSPIDAKVMQIGLTWNKEVPDVRIWATSGSTFLVNGVARDVLRYVPEDTGQAITNFYFYHGSTLGNVYVNSQTPGGVWKHKKVTKFVLERPTQTSLTNSFSPEELISLSGFPTEIEVGPAYPPQTYSFWETTEWECPSNVSTVTVRCWGGGGGGGATDDYSGSAAGGGGGGAFSSKNVTVTPGIIYTITVGSGGSGGVDGNINGQAGGDSWFVDAGTVMAKGGSGGTGALLDEDEAGGAGGASASGVGTTKFSGGAGADGSSTNYGGGGGASAGTNNNGATATNATGATGTNNGGNGGTGTTATAGGLPGGGGGGANGTAASATIRPGGAGAGGLVTLRY